MTEAILVSNGPGELYTWVQPVLKELQSRNLKVKTTICLIPCQFAAGDETDIARTFGADGVSSPKEFISFLTTGRRPPAWSGDKGFVISLGGSQTFALRLGRKLGYPTYRYHFIPSWHRDLKAIFVQDKPTERQARLKGAPNDRIKRVGNLVADAVDISTPPESTSFPHILLFPGSRDTFAVTLIPFFLALADKLGQIYPNASFVWPVFVANSSAVIFCHPTMVGSAFHFISSCARFVRPQYAARFNAVRPCWSLTFTLHPDSRRIFAFANALS